MANVAETAQKAFDDADEAKIRLTMAKLQVQWWINKNKDSDIDYTHRIQFLKFKAEQQGDRNGNKSNN